MSLTNMTWGNEPPKREPEPESETALTKRLDDTSPDVSRHDALAQTVNVMDFFWTLAERVAKTDLARNDRNKPESVFAKMMKGYEIGLQPMQSLDAIDMIQGTPTLKPEVMRAIIRNHGHDYDIVEMTAERCVIKAHRREWAPDRWSTYEFSMADARSMDLAGKDQWKKQPRNMLIARCTSLMGRAEFADVLHGMSYTPEEILDTIETTATVVTHSGPRNPERDAVVSSAEAGSSPATDAGPSSALDTLRTRFNALKDSQRQALKEWWKRNLPTEGTWPSGVMSKLPAGLIADAIEATEAIANGEVPLDLSPGPDDEPTTARRPPPVPASDDDGPIDAELIEDQPGAPGGQTVNVPQSSPAADSAPPQGETVEHATHSPAARAPGRVVNLPKGGHDAFEVLKAAMRERELRGPERFAALSRFFDRPIKRLDELSESDAILFVDYLDSEEFRDPGSAMERVVAAFGDVETVGNAGEAIG